ncbi:MAG: hypothetical protein ACREP9_12245, partial [Candidatus Dormibacteraceae bacterium]
MSLTENADSSPFEYKAGGSPDAYGKRAPVSVIAENDWRARVSPVAQPYVRRMERWQRPSNEG